MEKLSRCYRLYFEGIEKDPRIGMGHLAVFSAIFYMILRNEEGETLRAFSREIMQVAKISSKITCLRILGELAEYGYIEYIATNSKHQRNQFKLKERR